MRVKAIVARVGNIFSLENLQEIARTQPDYILEGNHLVKCMDVPDEVIEEKKWKVSMESLFKYTEKEKNDLD